MATITRYVNTASTAGGDGTTNATSGTTRAYASLNEWEADEQTDLVTDGDIHVVICEGATADTTAVSVDGWTTGASNYIQIKTDTAGRHDGKWATGAYRLVVALEYYAPIALNVEYIRIEGLQVEQTGAYAGGGYGIYNLINGSSSDIRIDSCIVRYTGGAGQGTSISGIGDVESSAKITVTNCAVYDFQNGIYFN